MLTGISGSNTVDSALTICGLSAAVRSGSATMAAVSEPAGTAADAADGFWITGICFMRLAGVLFCRDHFVAGFGRRAQRVPRERCALDADRKLAHAGQDRQLAEILDRLVDRRRHGAVKSLEQLLGFLDRFAFDHVGHQRR